MIDDAPLHNGMPIHQAVRPSRWPPPPLKKGAAKQWVAVSITSRSALRPDLSHPTSSMRCTWLAPFMLRQQ